MLVQVIDFGLLMIWVPDLPAEPSVGPMALVDSTDPPNSSIRLWRSTVTPNSRSGVGNMLSGDDDAFSGEAEDEPCNVTPPWSLAAA